MFLNVAKASNTFMVIPVTNYSCEQTFSNLSIVKTKLRSTMTQAHLVGLFTIKQELTYNINIDDIIDIFKMPHS